ncbi:hypothetical protein CKAH01_02419 [Colletotrichum kahawae]|uniref:Uncharacterized protein n=1 Tax=Colletotrichum kahawae TaxID=34407 RepID=A0AAE0CYT4_COLKA|nr:hypothetical protein CKAH01_02419 [Colletotrichum kahawae]
MSLPWTLYTGLLFGRCQRTQRGLASMCLPQCLVLGPRLPDAFLFLENCSVCRLPINARTFIPESKVRGSQLNRLTAAQSAVNPAVNLLPNPVQPASTRCADKCQSFARLCAPIAEGIP